MKTSTLTTLDEICESVRYGYTASASSEPCGPHFLRITDIVPESIDWGSVPYCEIGDADKERFSLSVDDIVVARTGATVGYAKLIREPIDAVFASYLVRFRINTAKADPGFIGRILESPLYKAYVHSRIGGAAQPNASAPVLGGYRFVLPPKQAQTKIAEILSAYDDLIENNRRRMALLEEAARQLYREWFVRLRFPGHEHTPIKKGVPEGWKLAILGNLCEEVRQTVAPDAVHRDTPYIGLEHMPRRSISLTDWGKAEEVVSNKHRFRQGEILFGKIRPYFHKVGLAPVDGLASSDAIVIRPLENKLRGLVLMTISSDPFVAVTAQAMREGSKMPRADWKQMQQYKVSLPPDGLLEDFEEFICSTVEQLRILILCNQKLRDARDLLLSRLMSGELVAKGREEINETRLRRNGCRNENGTTGAVAAGQSQQKI
jgi:type I restriction enzyme, S subunit